MIRLACFGAGRIGRVHALNAAAQPGVILTCLADPVASPEREALAAQTGASITDPDSIFADERIDGIIIASSTDSHAELLLRAAETGKAVFCEKPISLDMALTQEVTRRIEASGIPCMLGFQRRYDCSFRALRDRIASGVSGPLEQVVMFSRDPAPPPRSYVETSGGMFRDSSIHDVDMARFLLDEPIASVYAAGSCLISPEIGAAGDVDSVMITLVSASGRQAQIIACRRGPMGYDQRLEALCANEVLSVGNQPQSTLSITSAEGMLSAPPENYFIERFAQAYRDEMAAFVALIRDGTPPLAGIRDGYEAQRLVEAALQSAKTGQVVRLEGGA
ncbi:Gfo/Idh/MocA family oxidoreductase [Paracoccus siganidrum]|uniref:Inositol 2-dehydrogenase n=1 Tax=Paracoccus siganidrum TaxID=1276757 RepID=A0A419A105_9RHOB|nr:Gfo/Idh/MocA family oxidoreductase [Paracoccus siganidrum]RJL06690.1 inositol 2-dehydrogenase [Paracoccus siganidrum]RMC26965.1 inositol 2-dehydrogenase [Paracoccus siganidrum]